MEIEELYRLFRLWSEDAKGTLRLKSDGSGRITKRVRKGDRRVSKTVLRWNDLDDGVQVITEELTGDFVLTKQFCRVNGVNMK